MSTNDAAGLIFFDRHPPEISEGPTPEEKCVRGQPMQRTWHHFTSADDKFFAGFWEADPGCWRICYTENEFCESTVRAGDNFVIPAGFEGEWEVVETTRKIYVIYEP